MILKKTILLTSLIAAVSTTSGCELFQPQETVDPVTGQTVIVPVAPPRPSEPRDSNRGGGGGGGWTP